LKNNNLAAAMNINRGVLMSQSFSLGLAWVFLVRVQAQVSFASLGYIVTRLQKYF
jgi:hypothetical protein